MNNVNLNSSKKLFFTALWIDIVVTAIVAMSAFWSINTLKEIQSGALTYSQSLGESLQFWENFAKLTFLALIGVGLALVKWLDACYRFAKDATSANGFKNEGWTAWAWIVPIINLFKPYQIINEIYKAGSHGCKNHDDWKKESGSGLLLTWWIFWVVTHLLMVSLGKAMLGKSSQDDLSMPQAFGLLNMQIAACVVSIVISLMWFFVANHLTGRLLSRKRLSDGFQTQLPVHLGQISHSESSRTSCLFNTVNPLAESQFSNETQARVHSSALIEVDEGAVYSQIADELETGNTDKGEWTRLFAECDGDEVKVKIFYIKSRATKLISNAQAQIDRAEREQAILSREVPEFLALSEQGYTPVSRGLLSGILVRHLLNGLIAIETSRQQRCYKDIEHAARAAEEFVRDHRWTLKGLVIAVDRVFEIPKEH